MEGWLALDRTAGDLEGQLHRGIRERILSGRLAAGQRLPATRALAASLGVARSTVVAVYERLRAEGFLSAAAGAATRVAALPVSPFETAPPPAPAVAPAERTLAFAPGVPDLSAFPHAVWARCLGARARALRVHDMGYGDHAGLPELRAAIAAHAAAARGVAADADQVVVVPSTGAAIDLLARLLLRPRADAVWIEEPGYPTAQAVLRQAGARLLPVPCDPDGMDPARAPAGPPPRLIYVTPSHQYPTGVTMRLPRRLAVLEAAQAAGAVVLEDDYDSEFLAGRPLAALQGIDRAGRVAYLGTFSKVLAPGLRVAYAILPRWLVADVAVAQRLRGAVVPVHIQAALADFLRDGHLRAHIRRMAPVYAERMAVTAEALRRHCAPLLTVPEQGGGLQLAGWFRDPSIDDTAFAAALAAQGLAPRALSGFFLGPSRPGLLFGIAQAIAATAHAAASAVMAQHPIQRVLAKPAAGSAPAGRPAGCPPA
jgi:GntR family transcriptional regulator/MocR family aminotransferase